MDFNDIFKFDEITNDSDINSNDLNDKNKKKELLDSTLIDLNENKNVENLPEKLINPQKGSYVLNNEENMILDVPINSVIGSLSKVPFDNTLDTNTLINNSDKKIQNIFDTEALKTEPNALYPQLYSNFEYQMEEEHDNFDSYMNFPNSNIDINSNPYLYYYNNNFNQTEALPSYNSTDYLNYNSNFDINGLNSYYPFPTDIDMEDIDMDNYSLALNPTNDDNYKQVLAMAQESELKDAMTLPLLNNNNSLLENKKLKNINSLNPLIANALSSIPMNKSIDPSTEKITFDSNSLIIPNSEEDDAMTEDTFKYIYPMNNTKNKLLEENLKNNMNFDDLISMDTLSQQMSLNDNLIKAPLLNNKVNSLENLENLNLNDNGFVQNINSIYSDPKVDSESVKEDLLNNIKDMNNLLNFDFNNLDNILNNNDNLMKLKPQTTTTTDTKASTSLLSPEEISLLLNSVPPAKNEIQPVQPLNLIEDYKNIINSLNPQSKDNTDHLLKMFITSPKLTNSKSKEIKTSKDQLIENSFTPILSEKPLVNSPSMNASSSPLITDLLIESKDKTNKLIRSSSMPKLSFSSLTNKNSSTNSQHKLLNKSKSILKPHPKLNNSIKTPIQKKSPVLSKSKNNIIDKEIITSTNPVVVSSSVVTTSPSIPSTLNPLTKATSITTSSTPSTSSTSNVTLSTLPIFSNLTPLSNATTITTPSTSNSSTTTETTISNTKTATISKTIPITTTNSKSKTTTASISTLKSDPSIASISKSDPVATAATVTASTTSIPITSTIVTPTTKTSSSSTSKSSITSKTASTAAPVSTSNTLKVTPTPDVKPIATKPLMPLLSTPILETKPAISKATPLTSMSTASTSTTTAAKIVPKPIAPLTSLPLTAGITPLPLSSTLNQKSNLSVPPVLPPLLSNPKLFPFLFAADSNNLLSNAAKSMAENLAKSALPTSSSATSAPISSSTATTTTTTTNTTKINSTSTTTPAPLNAPVVNPITTALAALTNLPLPNPTASLLSTPLASKPLATTNPAIVSNLNKKKSNEEGNNKPTSNTPTTSPNLNTTTANANTGVSTTVANSDSKNNKNISKNNPYMDEKRRKFLERNRIAGNFFI